MRNFNEVNIRSFKIHVFLNTNEALVWKGFFLRKLWHQFLYIVYGCSCQTFYLVSMCTFSIWNSKECVRNCTSVCNKSSYNAPELEWKFCYYYCLGKSGFYLSTVKPKLKQLPLANHNRHKQHNKPSEFEVNACKQDQACDIKWGQVTIGTDFASDWLRNLQSFCFPITERCKVKPKPKQTWKNAWIS